MASGMAASFLVRLSKGAAGDPKDAPLLPQSPRCLLIVPAGGRLSVADLTPSACRCAHASESRGLRRRRSGSEPRKELPIKSDLSAETVLGFPSRMKKRISLLMPSRGRPKLVERFLGSVAAESAHPELVEVVLCVDDDDTGSHGIAFDELALKLVIVPRQTMGAYNAICLEHASGQITIAVNDDIVVRTEGWDEKVRELDARYPDGVYLGYANDLFKGHKMSTFPILSQQTCQLLGEPYPLIYKGAFIDTHLMDVFRRLEKRGYDRIAYAEDIVFEHVHYRNNPEALDATYSDRSRFGDDLTFIALAEARRLESDRLAAP